MLVGQQAGAGRQVHVCWSVNLLGQIGRCVGLSTMSFIHLGQVVSWNR